MVSYLERMLRIYNRLRRGPVTIEIISKWTQSAGIDVSERQLYRDLAELKKLRIAEGENVIEFTDEKNRKTWKMEYQTSDEKLSAFDINSFFLLKNFAPFCVANHRKDAIERIENLLYKSVSKNKFEQAIRANELCLRRTNYNDNMYGAIEHQQIEYLIWALHNSRAIIIESDLINPANIHLEKEAFPLTMLPLELVFHRGRVHIGGVTQEGRFLIFSLDKNFHFELTNIAFNRKEYLPAYLEKFATLYGISDPIDAEIYNIHLEFTQGYAESMKSFHWHESQQWAQLESGNYLLKLHCSIGRELVGFIAIGLDKIKVLQPEKLKDLMIRKFKGAAAVNELGLEIEEEAANAGY